MADQREGWWTYFHGDRPAPVPLRTMTKDSHISLPAVDVEGSGYDLDDLALYHALQDELNGVNNEPPRPLMQEQALQTINPDDLIPALPSVDDSDFNLGDWIDESYIDSASQAGSEASLPGSSGLGARFSDSVYSAQPAATTDDLTMPAPAPVSPVLASQSAPLVSVPMPVNPLLAYSPAPVPASVQTSPQAARRVPASRAAARGAATRAPPPTPFSPWYPAPAAPASSPAPAPAPASPQAVRRTAASRAGPRAASAQAAPQASTARGTTTRSATTQAAPQAGSQASTPRATTARTAAPRSAGPGDAAVPVNHAQRLVKNAPRAGPATPGSVQFIFQDPRLVASVPRNHVQRTAQDVPRVAPAPGPSSIPQFAAQDVHLAAPVSLGHAQAVLNARMNVPASTLVGSSRFPTEQNDHLDVPVSVSVGSAKSTARNVPLAMSGTVPVGSAQYTGLTPLAASVPRNLLELASSHVALDNHPLENVNFSLESIASFASTGHANTLMYSSCEEALTDHRPNELPEDATVPPDVATKKVYVWLLCIALQTVQFAVDGFTSKFEQVSSSGSVVELRAWQMLVSSLYLVPYYMTSNSHCSH